MQARGLWRIATGLAKKIVIGDFLAQAIVNRVFATPERFTALEVLLAVYAYAVQIYADFSGYSDVAIGSAALFGYELPENFDAPYVSQNLQEFWHRWHISLSTWLRDYLYKPLGGSRARAREDVPQPDDHDGARRPVARRLVELRHLGRRSTAGRSPSRACGSGRTRTASGQRRARSAGSVATLADVPLRVPRVDLLPRARRFAHATLALEPDGARGAGTLGHVTPKVVAGHRRGDASSTSCRATGRRARARPSRARPRVVQGLVLAAAALALHLAASAKPEPFVYGQF